MESIQMKMIHVQSHGTKFDKTKETKLTLSGMSVRELNQIGHRFEAKHNKDSDRTKHQDKTENLTLVSTKTLFSQNVFTINQLKKRSENMD